MSNLTRFGFVLAALSTTLLLGSAASSRAEVAASNIFVPSELVNSAAYGFPYAYAPSIISANGVYHAYFCSTGTGINDWDHVRHATSPDLVHWSAPNDLMQATPVERANCDPSVVLFNAGDGPYYYMVYSGNAVNVQTLNFVARATAPEGPFLKYTDRGTWEQNPPDPHAIIWPSVRYPDGSNRYGAGQPTLVVHNGSVYQWYTDTTNPNTPGNHIYLVTSTDMVNWSTAIPTNVDQASVDVKWDPVGSQFVMFELLNDQNQSSELSVQTSTDGITWSASQVICGAGCFPQWANNVGVSGSDQGALMGRQVLVAYGAPYGLNPAYTNAACTSANSPYCWAHWDLYGQLVNLNTAFTPSAMPYSMTSATSNDVLWPAQAVLDDSPATVYSSNAFTSAVNNRGTVLAAWMPALEVVSQLKLEARMYNGQALGFPLAYDVYITAPDNSAWNLVGRFYNQPDSTGKVQIPLGGPFETYGVMIVPALLGTDNYGGHYFQLADVNLAL